MIDGYVKTKRTTGHMGCIIIVSIVYYLSRENALKKKSIFRVGGVNVLACVVYSLLNVHFFTEYQFYFVCKITKSGNISLNESGQKCSIHSTNII